MSTKQHKKSKAKPPQPPIRFFNENVETQESLIQNGEIQRSFPPSSNVTP